MKQKKAAVAFLLAFLLLLFTGCAGKTEENLPETSSEDSAESTVVTEPVEITLDAAKTLISECRFDEAYEILLALKGDPEAYKLLECYVEYPNFTIDFPEEEKEDVYFEVKGYYDPEEEPELPPVEREAPPQLLFDFTNCEFDFGPNSFKYYHFTYDKKGRLENLVYKNKEINFEYDEDGLLLSRVFTEQRPMGGRYSYEFKETVLYDADGKPVHLFNNTQTVLFTYKDGLLSEKQVQDNYHAYFYQYFYENGRLITVNKNGKLDIKYEYDGDGNILSIENKSDSAESMKATYETDENGAVTRTETYGNGSIKKYDQKGNLIYYDSPTEGYGNLEYDEEGRLIFAEWSVNYEKKKAQLSYDETGRVEGAVVTKNGRSIKYIFTEYKAYYIPDAEIRAELLNTLLS